MIAEIRDHCGFVVGHSLHDVHKMNRALQHRGQDTVGIAAKNDDGIDVLRWEGLVDDFSLDSMHKLLKGYMFMGHVRYATSGEDNPAALFAGAHPRFIDGTVTRYETPSHIHLIARGASVAISHNGTIPNVKCKPDEIDTDVMLRVYKKYGIRWLMEKIPAAYAAAILDSNTKEAIVFRDRHGIRPAWIGEKDGRIVAASEDVAIWDIGGKPIREVKPGEAIFINRSSDDFRAEQMVDPVLHASFCFFEANYNSTLSSSFGGKTINDICYRIGRELAREYRPDVDMVTDLPNRPQAMARGYSDESRLPYVNVFYKVRKRRAFLEPTNRERADSIGCNLFVIDNIDLGGKRVLVIDDSVVRMNNAPDAAKKLRLRGAEWIGLALGTPPIGGSKDGCDYGCIFGVDMPPSDDFATKRYHAMAELQAASGFDGLHYISIEGMLKAHRVPPEHRCTYCIGGPNPLSEDEMCGLESLEI